MADPITLSDDDAAVVLEGIFDHLRRYRAREVIDGIEESRRLGVEEDVSSEMVDRASELKKVGAIRRRAPTNIEMLRIVFEQLRQRLIVLPAIVDGIEQRLGANQFVLRIDREFVSPDLRSSLEAKIDDLRPPRVDEILANYERVRELILDLVPPAKPRLSDG